MSRRALLQHSIASEAVMRALAREFGEDEELWGLTGLLHDVDYPATEATPEKHGLEGARLLEGKLPEEALTAIRAHNGEMTGCAPQTRFDFALRCGETITGLISAAALMRPTGYEGMEVKSIKKKIKCLLLLLRKKRILITESMNIHRKCLSEKQLQLQVVLLKATFVL